MSKTIIITGASTGFGRRTAETLVGRGHHVFAAMRNIKGKNKQHAKALEELGADIVEIDVTNERSIEGAIRSVLKKADAIDVLINNAGIASAGVTEAFTTAQVKELFDVNVFGVLAVSRAVLPTFRRQRNGLLINVGSILGRVTFPFFGAYGASKYAIEALTDSLRYELSQFGVDVALIQPSAYPTEMYNSIQHPAETDRVRSYGDIGQIPKAMFDNFAELFSGENAPNPDDVAYAISGLVDKSKGQRSARTIVGAPFGADTINDAVAPIQSKVVNGMQLGHLEKIQA